MNRMHRRNEPDLVRTIDLDHEQLLVLQDRAGARARVLFGGVWLTEEYPQGWAVPSPPPEGVKETWGGPAFPCEGRLGDRFAHGGEELVLARRGRTVLEALGRTRIEILQPLRRTAPWWPQGWATLRRVTPAVLTGAFAVVLSVLIGVGVPELLARGFQHAGSTGFVSQA